jgi:hypothetical protein
MSGIVKTASRDGREFMEWNPRFNLLETADIINSTNIPLKPQRALYRLVAAVPAFRNYDRLYRFLF